MQKFYKGRTNNHLTWVMVDATDFATPESALSAATKIKIYGKLRSATGVNFVSSGTGSLTNDIVHVGASVLGLYTIALAKADLSDASAAWYDQYIISLSATGAAYQALVVDGGIDDSYLSGVVSDAYSALVALSDAVSNAYSAAVVGASRALLAESAASDAASGVTVLLTRVPSTLISNINSMLVAGTFALGASNLSDIESRVWSADKSDYNASSQMGSLLNAAGAGADAATIAAKVWSDYQSKVGQSPSQVYSNISNMLSYISGVVSGLGAGASASAIADKVWSDYGSKVGATPSQAYSVALIAASAASDAASYALLVLSRLSDLDSRLVSDVSDLRSALSDFQSDFQSRVPKAVATNSQLSDLHSDLRSMLAVMSGVQSDLFSAVSDFHSDFQSRVPQAIVFTVAGLIDANVLRLNGVAASAQNLERSASVIHQGSVTGATTTTTLIDAALTEADTDFWKGRIIIFTSGALLGQATDITAFDPATDKLTFTALTNAPAAGVTYVIV